MRKYYAEDILESDVISILQSFQTEVRPILTKHKNYYLGKHPILNKPARDESLPNNKVVTNFVKSIVDTYCGYAIGIPARYESESIDGLEDIFNYNDTDREDSEYFREGLIFGRACEICYLDEDAQVRYKLLDPRECIPVYKPNLDEDLLYAIRFWEEPASNALESKYFVEVYDDTFVTLYSSTSGYSSLSPISKTVHHFSQCPITFFYINNDDTSLCEPIYSLQDAYNCLMSDALDDQESWSSAFLILKGAIADQEDLENMKKNRVLMFSDPSCSAEYLTKDATSTEISNLLSSTETKIREICACPNFSDASFGTSSGIAIKYRCMALENNTSTLINMFKVALQRRIELITDIMFVKGDVSVWRDVKIIFKRNLPVDDQALATGITTYRGLVPDKILLSQIPFIENADEAMKLLLEQEKLKIDLYNTDKDDNDDSDKVLE